MEHCRTSIYKEIGDLKLEHDLYLPEVLRDRKSSAVVFFHAGGLIVGNRKTWHPWWLQSYLNEAGIPFFNVDYRLIPSGGVTGHDIRQDVLDFFSYLQVTTFQDAKDEDFSIDMERIVVSGGSSGALLALLAGAVMDPKPKAIVSLYGMGGNFFTPWWLIAKDQVFWSGEPLLDLQGADSHLERFLHPLDMEHPDMKTPVSNCIPEQRPLVRLYIQLGKWLDYYTGQHEPSLSALLKPTLETTDWRNGNVTSLDLQTTFKDLIPEEHRVLFPQCNISSSFPPTLFTQTAKDLSIPSTESAHIFELLKAAGAETENMVLPGEVHIWDTVENAEEVYKDEMQRIREYCAKALGAAV